MVVGQCGKNFAEAGRLLKKDPKTVRDLYNAGLKNAGRLAPMLIGKPKTRHGIEIASGDVGASPSHAGKTKINREHR